MLLKGLKSHYISQVCYCYLFQKMAKTFIFLNLFEIPLVESVVFVVIKSIKMEGKLVADTSMAKISCNLVSQTVKIAAIPCISLLHKKCCA